MSELFSFYVQKYFLSYLISQRGYGENTLTSYRDTFRLLMLFLDDKGNNAATLKLMDLDRTIVLSFLGWLESERQNSITTRNVRLAHLTSFFRFVMMTSPEISYHCSQIINIPFSKTTKKPPIYMNESETSHLLRAPDSNTKKGLRHLAILSLLYDSGCRVQEIINLNVADITLDKCSRLYVKGKGNKYREIPIMDETRRILNKYFNLFELGNQDILFSNRSGHRLTRQGVCYILKKYQYIVHGQYPKELTQKISPHLLRHSKATHLVNAGVNIYNVRDFLGHASVTTTQVYLTSNPEVTRKALEAAASNTVPKSSAYFTKKAKTDLLTFLDELI